MSLLKITEGADPNYLLTVVKIPKIKDHPNADRLSIVEIFGNTIIIGKGSYEEGENVVYFPVESAISTKFLSWANLLTKPELNADGQTKGFFESKGRVRAVSLRGIPSQGFLFKTSKLAEYFNVSDTFKVGDTFDTVVMKFLLRNTSKVMPRHRENLLSRRLDFLSGWILQLDISLVLFVGRLICL